MSLVNFLLLLLVAAICGSIGQALAGYSIGGCITSTIVGFIGALFGRWLASNLGLPEPLQVTIGGETFPVLWSIIGSALLVAILALFTRRRLLA
jgi:uncharacterized membrane protein YeaQ/YmgE (transglycosylase-associated protein family)